MVNSLCGLALCLEFEASATLLRVALSARLCPGGVSNDWLSCYSCFSFEDETSFWWIEM